MLGVLYDKGLEGVPVNEEKALYWLEKAKEQKLERATDYLIQRTARKKFEELIESQQQEFETKINQQIVEFQNQKSTIVENAKNELKDQAENAKKDSEKQKAEFETSINDKIKQFEIDKSLLIENAKNDLKDQAENAKKDSEKHGQFYLTVFAGVSLAITFAFIAIMFSYLTSSLEGIKQTLQAQFDSPKLKIERIEELQKEVESLKAKLTVLEEKNTKQTPTQKH